MANFEIPEILEYIDRIRKLEPTDPAHADLFNAMFQALINNGAFLKKMQEKQAADAQEQTQQQYEQLTGYTDMKIGELINGAPETLDTIKEVADAILENETIVEALNEAVGKKLNKDGDLTDTTVTFTSEDDENPTTWTAMRKVVSGKLKDILGSVSIMAKNLNYLRKMLGTDDISMLGNGTLTGAVSKLNTDLQYKDISNEVTMLMEGIPAKAYIENGMVIILSAIPKQYSGGTGELLQVPLKYAPRILVFGVMGYTWTRFDVGKVCHVMVSESGKVSFFQREPLNEIEQFTIQYPLKRG